MDTPAVPGAFEAIAALGVGPFGGRVHVVSKAGPKIARLTREWFAHTDFFARTGVPADNVRFVRHRHEKAPVCDELGITHFVDDRLSVLEHLRALPHLYLFVGGLGPHPPPAEIPTWVTASDRWPDLADLIESQLQ